MNVPMVPGVAVNNISLDSRTIRQGDLFVALEGASGHGARYIDAAIDKGAKAVLMDAAAPASNQEQYSIPLIRVANLKHNLAELGDRIYADPSARLSLIAITGTNGKTTCAHLTAQALEQLGAKAAIVGTAGQGLINTLEPSSLTTPDIFELRRLLAEFAEAGAQTVTFEASSHGLQQGRLDKLKLETAVFTNLSHDHLDYHKDLESYANAKLSLFKFPGLQNAVMNADQPLVEDFAGQTTAGKVWFYGESEAVDVRLLQIDSMPNGLRMTLRTHRGEFQFRSKLLGRINAENLLAVFTTLLACGYDEDRICRVLPNLLSVPGRMEVFGGDHAQPMVIVDYAHTPDALEKALVSLRDHLRGRLICVFGCGGDRDKDKRQKMGMIAQTNADICVVTDDNPRHENPDDIIAGIVSGMSRLDHSVQLEVIRDRPQAIEWAIRQAGENDIVLIAGKGHENTQQIGDDFIHMSDREIVSEIMEALR